MTRRSSLGAVEAQHGTGTTLWSIVLAYCDFALKKMGKILMMTVELAMMMVVMMGMTTMTE